MSSYLNAVKSGKSSSGGPPPVQQQPPPQPEKPALPPVQDEVDEVEEAVDEAPVEEGYEEVSVVRGNKKSTGGFSRIEFDNEEKEDEFWRLFFVTAGPAGFCNFGLTCTYFCDKFFSTPDLWNLVQSQLPPFIKPVVNILVETSFTQNAGQEKILTLPLTSLKQPYQKQNVVDYWMKILAKAEKEREKDKSKDPTQQNLDANLNGGINIETGTGKNTQTIVYLQDLSVIHSLLHAIGQLIRKTHYSVKLPYRNGNIILSLYGRGGTCISLNVKSGKDNIKSIFPLEDFANQCRKTAKKFVSLVGYCHVYLRRTSNDSTEKEHWILHKLEHDCLNKDVIQIRNKLASGVVPGSLLPAHFQKKILLSKKKQDQDQIENSDIMDLILENLPENWNQAIAAADRLLKAAVDQRDNEKIERQARRDLQRQEEKRRIEEAENLKKNEENPDVNEQIPKKAKTKVVNKKGKDGWVKVTVATLDDEGKEIENPVDEEGNEVEKPVKPVKPKKQSVKQSSETATATNNIFTFADESENLPSLSEYQASFRENKLKGQQEVVQRQPKNKPLKKSAKQPVENKENGEKGKEDEHKKVKKEKKMNQPVGEKKRPQYQAKDVPFWQNDLFRPLLYVFVFVTLISVLYLTLN